MIPMMMLLACSGGDAYIVEGTVVEVHAPSEVVIDHQEVRGLMEAMTMPFDVRDPALLDGVTAGDTVVARFIIDQQGGYIAALRVTGHTDPPKLDVGAWPLRPGEVLPAYDVEAEDGSTIRIGEGQGIPTAVAFLYTTCPMPEFCPLLVKRFQGLQAAIGTDARLVTLTIDPDTDTREVLAAFGQGSGAKPETWRLGRLPPDRLADLVSRVSLGIDRRDGRIEHGERMLVLDASGKLIERYDDNRWPEDRVVQQLRTGGPAAPQGSDGTITPETP
jgi:protein SCO1/2